MQVDRFVPYYERVAEDIRQQIRDGRLQPGDKLPSIREMMALYGRSGTVIDTAILMLKVTGWIRGHQGVGLFVADTPPIAQSG